MTDSARSGLVIARGLSTLLIVVVACGPHHASTIEGRPDCPMSWSVAPLRSDTVQSTEGKIAGRIVDARNGTSVDGAQVRLTSATGAEDSVLARDGTFEFAPLVVGTYEVRTVRIGYHPRRDTLRLHGTVAMNVTLSIDEAPSDECHGLEVVTRKPWWKFW
jgi:hypothetical protein